MKTIEIRVQGLVQGVGFRYFTVKEASKYGIKGYVKNLFNGNVYIIAQGKEFQLEEFIKSIRIGPVASNVTNVFINDIQTSEVFEDFTIKY